MAQENDDGSLQITIQSHSAQLKDKIALAKTMADDEDDEEAKPKQEEIKVQELVYDFTAVTLIRESAMSDLLATINL
jgi:F0F1-type ATP synthase assembly protein I